MKKIAGRKSEDDAKIDLTPMLDVVFILLIFFVVTATFLSETSISAASSDNNNNDTPPEDNDKKNILFEIGANNEIILNGNPRPIIPTQIRSNIEFDTGFDTAGPEWFSGAKTVKPVKRLA